MSIGAGLGGFMDGLTRGMGAREAIDQRKRNKIIEQRQDTEYNRAVQQRDEVSAINTGAKAEFDKRVAAGTEKATNFDQFWAGYALPKLKNTYLSQGNMEMAEKVQAWGDSADAKAGARYAMSALTKAQTGDAAGALSDAIEAGKTKGYIAHGFEIKGQDTIVDPEGKLQGYRLYLKGPDGKDIEQDLPLDQVPKMIATYLNPEAAWQSQIASANEKAKTQSELTTYEEKKKIDKRYGTGTDKGRSDAISALRKRMDGGLAGTDQTFDDLPRDEQEKLIGAEIELQSGQPGLSAAPPAAAGNQASGRKVLVDTSTGRPVAQAPMPSERRSSAPSAKKPETREEAVSYLLQAAEVAIQDGERPERIAMELKANGIPEDRWPPALRKVLVDQRARGIVGIGGQ